MARNARMRHQRLADMSGSLGPPEPRFRRYRLEHGRQENEFDLGPDLLVYHSAWYDGHRLTDFVYVLRLKERARWRVVMKIDCCHDKVHQHIIKKNNSEVVKDLEEIWVAEDLQRGLGKATALMFDDAGNHVRRWQRGR